MEMRCYRKILHISYKDHFTNEEIRAKIKQAIRPHEKLLIIAKRLKLKWYGHVSRSSGLAKTILQGTVKGGRRQGRQRKRWEDNIREWTGLEFAKSQRDDDHCIATGRNNVPSVYENRIKYTVANLHLHLPSNLMIAIKSREI